MEKAFDDAEDLSSLLTFDLLKVSKGSEGWSFSGVASDEGEDEDGDAILRKQLDISYAQQRGYVNWNHSRNPADQIGYLTKCEIIGPDQKDQLKKDLGIDIPDSASVFVEGRLYEHVGRAQEVRNIMRSATDASRGPGLSLDGSVARTKGKLTKAIVRGVAFTPMPAQRRTLAVLKKSLANGIETELEDLAKNPFGGGEVAMVADGPEEHQPLELRIAMAVAAVMESREKAKEGNFTFEEAVLFTLKRYPTWNMRMAERFVLFVMGKQPEETDNG